MPMGWCFAQLLTRAVCWVANSHRNYVTKKILSVVLRVFARIQLLRVAQVRQPSQLH